MEGGGPWTLNAGQVTDDSELAMCLLEYLSRNDGGGPALPFEKRSSFTARDVLDLYERCNKGQLDVGNMRAQLE